MSNSEIVEKWLDWLKNSIDTTIIEIHSEDDANWIIHYIKESVEADLGKFERGLKKEILTKVLKGE